MKRFAPPRTKPFITRTLLLIVGAVWFAIEIPGTGAGTNTALQFNGTNQYVTFGAAPGLGAATFTLETWFKRTGAGVGASTGTGGLASAIPLITKGRGEAEASNVDMNYFFGIDASSGRLVADFEEGASGTTPGLNHPVTGTTVVTSNVWHHAAVTYDGTTWRLYLDGAADGSLSVGQPTRADSIQHAGLATAMTSTGAAAGFFQGILDEARIWNVARSQAQIQSTKDLHIVAGSNLVARWGMNEASGTVVGDSISVPPINGTTVGTPTPTWVTDVPLVDASAPAVPPNVTASPGNKIITLAWNPNTELDFAGYNVYRSQTQPVPTTGAPLNGSTPIRSNVFTDTGLTNFATYYYAIRALDASGNASNASSEVGATPDSAAGAALLFDGNNDYVTFGPAASLGVATFTIETWFNRTGAGVGNTTGGGGIASAIPLVTKGRNETEGSNVDMNYFLGIDATSGVLVADFEEGPGGPGPLGQNHPVSGTTSIPIANVWHHAAATYDGRTWKLYLDGNLDKTLDLGSQIPPRFDSIQHAAIGTGLTSGGVAAGFFQGLIDEPRIWNFARSQAQLQGTMNQEVTTGVGLIGRWGLNEGTGTSIANSALGGTAGTLTNGPAWAAGRAFNPNTNQPPVADAGADSTITLPAAASLDGTATDDGLPTPPGAVTTVWSKASGPGTVTFGNANAGVTTASFSASGVYVLRLTANDGLLATSDDVTVVANQAPAVNAGTDLTITLPAAASLSGTATDDGLPNPPASLTTSWSQVSGPGTVAFGNANALSTTATFSTAGPYVLRLTANDGLATLSDDVTITVNPRVNQAPVVNAGADQSISLPATASVSGTINDDGLPGPTVNSTWSKVSGPGTVTFADASSASTTASFSVAGVYVLRLTASDTLLTGSDDVTVTVNPVPGNYAIDFGGTNAYVTFGNPSALGLATFTLEAKFRRDGVGVTTTTGTGGITAAIPLVTKGRGEADNANNLDMNYFFGIDSVTNTLAADFEEGATGASPSANHPVRGTTVLQNGVWYHAAATYDGTTWRLYLNGALEAQVTVGQPPRVDSIQHAAIGSALTSTGAAAGFFDGVIDEVRIWDHARTQIEVRTDANQEMTTGAGLVARWGLNAGIATLVVNSTTTSGLDGTITGANFTWVSGAPAVNLLPIADAGSDQSVTYPAAATLSGAATDDGLPNPSLTSTWSKFSGPGTVTFGNAASPSTSATFSSAGTYVLRLTVSDGELAAFDDVTVTVAVPTNQPPVVNAGADQTIALPSAASLSGTVTDDGLPGSTVTSTWSKGSGPGSVTFADVNATSTSATFSIAGIYVLRLTADDGLLTASDDVTVTVNPTPGNYALDFGGTDAYVPFGSTSALGLPIFTLEAKFRRDGAGIGTNTGDGGIANAIPLVTKGRAQAEGSNVDMNYFLGIDAATGVLVADFEEGPGGPGPLGQNHPVSGTTVIPVGSGWHHAAVTYDGRVWKLYLDGVLETTLDLMSAITPRSDSIQHAAIGSALNSTGVAAGFFAGALDDVRIWNYARTQTEIRGSLNQLAGATGLVARWGLDAGIGTAINDSTTHAINGTITGSNWSWVTGAPDINLSPTVSAGSDQAVTLPAAATLTGSVVDDGLPNPGSLTSTWSMTSGPGTVTFGNVNTPNTTASFSAPGTYVLRLTATDSLLAAFDDVTVVVSAPPNQAPVVSAGADQAITLPATALLAGTITDDGVPGPVTPTWSKQSGPGSVTFGNVNATSTTASFSVAGLYVLRLTGNDGQLSSSDDVTITVNPSPGNYALDFGGTNAYVTFGPAAALGLPIFTLEAKFRRDGAGVGTSTGTGGIASAIPLVTKGRAESENSTVDMNYFLGIDGATGKLMADFEEGATAAQPGLNHPITGTTVLQNGVWYHAAATYDGTTWRLYLNGALESQSAVGQLPRADSIQHAAIGSALDSTGVAAGFFDGVIDEVRIWSNARSQTQIRTALNQELASGTGLVARWGLNEGVGTTVNDAVGTAPAGTITGAAWNWTSGAPLINLAPAVNAGTDQSIMLPATATLSGTVTDDGLPNPPATTTVTWSMVSGPAPVSFANVNAPSTTATFSMVGGYVLALTASDGAATASDEVTITVAGNQAPVVEAGPSQSITLPAEALLNGSAIDDGLPNPATLTVSWAKVSGPGVVTFDEASSPITGVSFSAAGSYVLRLTATDGELTSNDDTTITVNAAGSAANQGIGLGGTNAYVTFGNPAKLHLATFTVETWFNRQGTGVGTNTGSSGLDPVLPLVTRGMAETETAATDMNYFLGIDMSSNVLAADFEEGAAGTTPGLNHPIRGTTTIANNVWHHAAATYDGSKWQLFLDGVLESELTVGQPVAAAGNQHAAIGTALNSTGGVGTQTQGFFNGVLDEVRIWNRALTASEIAANANTEIFSANGLVARWGLNEGAGTSVSDSVSPPATGTIVGTNWTWAGGAPFNVNHAPGIPVLVAPANSGTELTSPAALKVAVSDPDAGNLTVTYWGRPKSTSTAGPDFTLIALPDTQFYTSSLNGGTPAIFNSQTQWIVQNLALRNIVFVTQLGDCVQNGDNSGNPVEWINADAAMSRIEDPLTTLLTHGIPYGIAVGNHDQSPIGDANGTTNFYNQYFGSTRFAGRPYYGGHYASNNDNHYELFSASGLDFIIIHLEYDTAANPAVLSWANSLLQTYSNRRGIVVSHYIINAGNPGTFGTQGQAIYNALKGNPNLFLMLSGHVSPPEGQRQDTFNGNTVTTLMSDYQSRTNGGNGWLRIMEFSPANNQIRVKTYSPWLNQFETDADSQFTVDYNMSGGNVPFSVISTNTGVAPGATTTADWSNLASNTAYEWYVTVSDGITTTTGPTWTFSTTTTNAAPVANSRTLTTAEDTGAAVTLTASDAENDALTYSIVNAPAHGTVTGTAPNVTYTPAANYNGSDSFTFKANDGTSDSNIATVSVTITPVSDPPVAVAQAVTTTEDTAKVITLSASDPDGDTLTYTIVAAPTHGTLAGSGSTRTYTPAANYSGPDSFTFRAADATTNSNVATVSLTVSPVNDPPVAANQSVATAADTAKGITLTATDAEGSPLTFAVVTGPAHGALTGTAPNVIYTPASGYTGADSFTFRANDGSLDSNVGTVSINVAVSPVAQPQTVITAEDTAKPLVLTSTNPNGGTLTFTIVTSPAHGTLSGTPPNVTYTPSANYNASDSFTFNSSDGISTSNVATVTISVTPVNDPPLATDGSYNTPKNRPITGVLTGSDIDSLSLTFSIVSQGRKGTAEVTNPATGAFTYVPSSSANGSDTFTFKVNDGLLDSNTATVTIKFSATVTNTAPVASNGSISTPEDAAVNGTLTATDGQSDPLIYRIITNGAKGTATITNTATGAFTYAPNPNANGSDSFTFRANDGVADSNVATVSVTITAVNDVPVANADTVTVASNASVSIPVLVNDTDADQDVLAIVSATQGANGTTVINGTSVTYTPAAGYTGPDSFTYLAKDPSGATSAAATVTVTVTAANQPPVAAPQSPTTAEDTAISIVLSASDPEANPLTFSVVTSPAHGSLSGAAPNLTYTPAANYNGPDSFTFKANDGSHDSNVATVSITIAAVNDAPAANGDAASVASGSAVTISVLANDTDADQDALAIASVTQPAHGTTAINGTGVTYTSTAGYAGADTFTYVARDPSGATSSPTTVTMTVTGLNRPPVASDQAVTTAEDTARQIVLGATDPENNPLTFTIVSAPAHGVLSGTGPNRTYTPTANYNGSDSFTFKANDGTTDSNVATVSIAISAVNDAPVAVDSTLTASRGVATPGTLTASDVDGDALTTFVIVTPPKKGTVSVGAGNQFVYTSTSNAKGQDSFTFKTSDGKADSNVAKVTVTIK